MESFVNEFLGTGWKFPVEFNVETAGAMMTSGEELVRSSLDVLFTTPIGDRIMHPDYGSELNWFVFEPVSKSTITYMKALISNAILFNEPRIVLNAIDITMYPDGAHLEILVDYTISATNNRYNYVYPFYLLEATNLYK
jgi:phage baseplate assembly protein W